MELIGPRAGENQRNKEGVEDCLERRGRFGRSNGFENCESKQRSKRGGCGSTIDIDCVVVKHGQRRFVVLAKGKNQTLPEPGGVDRAPGVACPMHRARNEISNCDAYRRREKRGYDHRNCQLSDDRERRQGAKHEAADDRGPIQNPGCDAGFAGFWRRKRMSRGLHFEILARDPRLRATWDSKIRAGEIQTGFCRIIGLWRRVRIPMGASIPGTHVRRVVKNGGAYIMATRKEWRVAKIREW